MTHRVRNNTNIISMQNKMFPATEFIRDRDIHVNRHHYLCVCVEMVTFVVSLLDWTMSMSLFTF